MHARKRKNNFVFWNNRISNIILIEIFADENITFIFVSLDWYNNGFDKWDAPLDNSARSTSNKEKIYLKYTNWTLLRPTKLQYFEHRSYMRFTIIPLVSTNVTDDREKVFGIDYI